MTDIRKMIYLLALLLSILISLNAVEIDTKTPMPLSLLEKSEVYLSKNSIAPDTVPKLPFCSHNDNCINIGISQKDIWVRFTLENNSSSEIEKILVVTSPLLEDIALYRQTTISTPELRGINHITHAHHTLFPYFTISLPPHTSTHYYMNIHSIFTPVDFRLILHDRQSYIQEDHLQQMENIFLIGFVLALALYSLLIFLYIKDKSYFYYSLYLFALIYQQITYLGLTQLYFPLPFIMADIHIPVLKVALLIITASLFALHFLKIDKSDPLYKGYRLFIAVSIIEIVLFTTPHFFNLDTIILTGTLFIIFNLGAGVIAYRRGVRQARLFIVGFSIVFLSYALVILDALGLTSIMQHFQNILIYGTALEALILSLAFADRYIILQKEKELADAWILSETRNRTTIIQKEVEKKTKELNQALQTKELLLQEIHHRVKNNLQIILSMIRLQNDETHNALLHEKLTDLEYRISAIAKTYTMLLGTDDLEQIEMDEYVDALVNDIAEAYNFKQHNIAIHTDIQAYLPLKQAVYTGLIINELVTNAFKYAFQHEDGTIIVSLFQKENRYTLCVEDSGKGYIPAEEASGLGMRLLQTLVKDQLEGTLEIQAFPHTKYIIRFSI